MKFRLLPVGKVSLLLVGSLLLGHYSPSSASAEEARRIPEYWKLKLLGLYEGQLFASHQDKPGADCEADARGGPISGRMFQDEATEEYFWEGFDCWLPGGENLDARCVGGTLGEFPLPEMRVQRFIVEEQQFQVEGRFSLRENEYCFRAEGKWATKRREGVD